MCILIVDDEALVRESVSEYLEDRGYQVLHANSGEHALEVAREFGHRIKAVVSDIEMPHLNGIEMWRRMKEIVRPACKILFLTGNAPEYSDKALVVELLAKPVSLSKIAVVLETMLSSP